VVWYCSKNGKSLVTRTSYFRAEQHENKEEGGRKHDTPNYWVLRLCLSSSILKSIKPNFSEIGSVSVLRWGEIPTLLGPSHRPYLNHWTTHVRVTLTSWLAVYVQAVRLGDKPPWVPRPVFFLNWIFSVIFLMQHPLWWEDVIVVYNCCWPSPAQSFSDLGSAGLVTIFYWLKFEIPPTWRARFP
jgi:hypothetical protein